MTHAVDGFLVREVTRRCNYDREALIRTAALLEKHRGHIATTADLHPIAEAAYNHGFLSLRGAELITPDNVLEFPSGYRNELLELIQEILIRPSFIVLCIHDEFKCHPNYVNDMREVYRDVLAELADSRVGEQIIQEVRNDPDYRLDKISTDLGDAIMDGEYFLS